MLLGSAPANSSDLGTVISVEPDEIIIKGSAPCSPGGRLYVIGYNGERVAVIEVTAVRSGEYSCKKVHGSGDIRVGYTVKQRPTVVGALFLEAARIKLNQSNNPSYVQVSGETANGATSAGTAVTLGMFALSKGWGPKYLHGYTATAYLDLGKIKCWDIIQMGATIRPHLKREVAYVEVGSCAGLGALFGKLKWARPDSSYDDQLERNAGEAKGRTLGAGTCITYRAWLGASLNLSPHIGLMAKLGYYGYYIDKFVDSESTKDIEYLIKDEWLQNSIGSGGLTFGIAFLWNAAGSSR